MEQETDVLDEPTWRARAAAHEARVDAWLLPHLERRRERVAHPVHDFLFTYYSHRPAQLRRWHPGFGVVLEGAGGHAAFAGYERVECAGCRGPGGAAHSTRVSRKYVDGRRPLITSIRDLLVATEGRPPAFGCFGLHEWAMVHRLEPDQTRHAQWPLRLGPAGTDAVVESQRIACSHFDAFRFFTPSARPLNTLRPGSDDRAEFEQPGCLHAGMDLYKHAFRLSPMVPSELVADCFELARDIRELDMRASPYDLSELGYEPVRIETPEGRREYADAQRGFTERGAPLRRRLIEACERLLGPRCPPR